MKYSEIVLRIARKLESTYKEPALARINAWWLLESLTQKTHTELITDNTSLTQEQYALLDRWVYEIIFEHKPIQYIVGKIPFLNITLNTRPPVLIPRPETEEWCASLIKLLNTAGIQDFTLLDLCTGSGCLALAIAHAFPLAKIYAVDNADYALELARENASAQGITNCTFILSDLFQDISHSLEFDIIIANPPYITSTAWNSLDPEVSRWEAYTALVAPHEGLEVIQKIIAGAEDRITKKLTIPQLWIEIGYDQGQTVARMMRDAGLHTVKILLDYQGHDRVVLGEYT